MPCVMSRKGWLVPVLAAPLLLSAAAGSCDDPDTRKSAPPEKAGTLPAAGEGKVGLRWQKVLLEELDKDPKAIEAVGLFSSGGWSDAGQKIVLLGAGSARLLAVPASGREIKVRRDLTQAEASKLRTAVSKASKLADVNETMFDGLVYEYVHATKTDGASRIDERVFIRSSGKTKHAEHEALIGAFP